MAVSQCAPAQENKWTAVSHRRFSSITPGVIVFWGSVKISTGGAEQEGQADTDYQHLFSVLNEISDDLEDQGCLGRPRWAQQLENVSTSQATV